LLTVIFYGKSTCSAQIYPYSLFTPFTPFFPTYDLFLPLFPTLPAFENPFTIPMLSPTLTPYTASLPTFPRSAAATIIVLPPTTPTVTAYAPLGTLNLTPSTLVFLILYLTLPE
jgi:hypothetical protein